MSHVRDLLGGPRAFLVLSLSFDVGRPLKLIPIDEPQRKCQFRQKVEEKWIVKNL